MKKSRDILAIIVLLAVAVVGYYFLFGKRPMIHVNNRLGVIVCGEIQVPHCVTKAVNMENPSGSDKAETIDLAKKGNPEEAFRLGSMYEHGEGVTKDYAEAFKWYQLAAERGYAKAQVAVGGLYASGTGTKQDDALAYSWYQKAADGGDYAAMGHVAEMYEKGSGVKQDYAEAYFWYSLAERITFGRITSETSPGVANHLSTEQKATIEARVGEWLNAHPGATTLPGVQKN